MKLAVVCVALAISLAATAANAGNGNGNGNAYGHDKGDSGNGGGNNGANGNGNANGHDKATIPAGAVFSPAGLVTTGADQNIALDAVKSGAALPLDQIEPKAVRRWGGRVIDAHLIKSDGTLLYKLNMLSDAGVLRPVYYDARTGASVPGP